MGWAGKLFLILVGAAAFGLGLWPVGLLCFGYFLFSLRSRRRSGGPPGERQSGPDRFPFRMLVAAVLGVLAFAAYTSGGVLSPAVMSALAVFTLAYPWLPIGSLTNGILPVEGSILLRRRYNPVRWHALAVFKPGPEDFSRALSSFSGQLIISEMKGAAIYAVFTVLALGRASAEKSMISRMREAARSLPPSGAYLLPVDSRLLPGFLLLKLKGCKRVKGTRTDLVEVVADVLVLESRLGFISATAAYTASGTPGNKAMLPPAPRRLSYTPQLWELLEIIGRRSPWPGPDACSGLLSSLHATRGEPIGERLAGLKGSRANVSVKGLGSEELELSRPQFRAIAEIYQ